MSGYNTNLAAEFHVMSVLHRFGADASLALGNKKSVDIAVIRGEGEAVTVDVKGLAGKTGWPVDNFVEKKGHFLALVCFLGKIDDPKQLPETYVVPAAKAAGHIYHAPGGRKVIPLSRARELGAEFRDAWVQLL
ncbi:MAG TPA: hypothetical protein VK324_02970 [Tepidisphaeraceae bacterium]|nr:hypothetical protein [Tepidisphaeraceae bacterium]